MPHTDQNIHWQLLQKEMDFIEGTVKNLDDIIYKTKNFAFLTWGGSLYLFADHFKNLEAQKAWLYLLTAIIPLLFWVMDYRWRKHLLKCGDRKRIIAKFINSPDFEKMIVHDKKFPAGEQFPFYDPVGWIYTRQKFGNEGFADHYLVDDDKFGWRKVTFYKDAYIFYGTMMLLSIVFSIFYAVSLWK